jgi:esterase/lipase superfamily enzyme
VRIALRESEDEDADRDRLERLLATLREFPGDEEVRLTVHTLGGDAQTTALGRLRVAWSDELSGRLSTVLGEAGEAIS